MDEAVKSILALAEQGNADAQHDLALRYYKGDGVEQNLVEAVKWYGKAADQGHLAAQSAMGLDMLKMIQGRQESRITVKPPNKNSRRPTST